MKPITVVALASSAVGLALTFAFAQEPATADDAVVAQPHARLMMHRQVHEPDSEFEPANLAVRSAMPHQDGVPGRECDNAHDRQGARAGNAGEQGSHMQARGGGNTASETHGPRRANGNGAHAQSGKPGGHPSR